MSATYCLAGVTGPRPLTWPLRAARLFGGPGAVPVERGGANPGWGPSSPESGGWGLVRGIRFSLTLLPHFEGFLVGAKKYHLTQATRRQEDWGKEKQNKVEELLSCWVYTGKSEFYGEKLWNTLKWAKRLLGDFSEKTVWHTFLGILILCGLPIYLCRTLYSSVVGSEKPQEILQSVGMDIESYRSLQKVILHLFANSSSAHNVTIWVL